MAIASDDPRASRALVSAYSTQDAVATNQKPTQQGSTVSRHSTVPRPSTSRLASSQNEQPYCLDRFVEEVSSRPKDETVLYLAYGSNFAAEKFKGERGIKPLSQIIVQVPSLRLTFDLPGIPYVEPCFANSARRDPKNDPPRESSSQGDDEKTALLDGKPRYRKDAWHKGLIGVVYEVTPEDYAHIIATEGGGAGYQDILVDCHPFASSDPKEPVPQNPTLPPFKAHTLFAPAIPDDGGPPENGGHLQRPDPDYAQASARYLKLITDGAAECELPYEYQDYLLSLQPYTITTKKQLMAKVLVSITWVPLVLMMIQISKLFVDENGRLPPWMRKLTAMLFEAVWATYDNAYKPLFGDGERTVGDNGDKEHHSSLRQGDGALDLEKGRQSSM